MCHLKVISASHACIHLVNEYNVMLTLKYPFLINLSKKGMQFDRELCSLLNDTSGLMYLFER